MPGAERIYCLQEILKVMGWQEGFSFTQGRLLLREYGPAFLSGHPSDEYMLFVRRGYDIAVAESWLDAGRIVNERSLEKIIQTMFSGPGLPGEKIGTSWIY